MKLISLKQFEKKSRGSLMRFINGYLKTQSKKQIAIFAYTLAKSKLPRLRTIRQKALPATQEEFERRIAFGKADWTGKTKRKTKRKARFRKGSPEAKRYMANLRRMRK